MARRRRAPPDPTPPKPPTPPPKHTPPLDPTPPPESIKQPTSTTRMVTPASGIAQPLPLMQLFHYMPGMGSAPTVLQPQTSAGSIIPDPPVTNSTVAARKLTYSAEGEEKGKSLAEVVRGN
ncbi:classical arabinogalactan protein 4-like [Lycium barbarum]|uniref:classical arabinogalactan protein 4-like n=1 Tax=Lycium barbarum TaxID=112863 RepID=UPI00293F6239|nr:classical arabinogalactan protein 4-like [Lycium barbarum]